MTVETHTIQLRTLGNGHVVDLSDELAQCLGSGGVRDGTVTLFVVGSTAGITTTEFEPGLAGTDLDALFERIAPRDGQYAHEAAWNDDNGHSHVRASLVGPSLSVPLVGGRLALGTWQQVVLMDFDTRPRHREVVVQVIGE
jgi:secondary thiamine-phosphate synthase enzyme